VRALVPTSLCSIWAVTCQCFSFEVTFLQKGKRGCLFYPKSSMDWTLVSLLLADMQPIAVLSVK
jgi:hypothetical protein